MKQKIAFLILAHGDFPHLQRLCTVLGSDDDIIIHIDLKTPIESLAKHKFSPNVRFVRRRVHVHWADISMVDATLSLIDDALSTGESYLRLVLLSGSCYPIQRLEVLRNHFMSRPQHCEIKYFNGLESRSDIMRKVSRFYFKEPLLSGLRCGTLDNPILWFADRAVRKSASLTLSGLDRHFARKFPGLIPYFGHQFWSITTECAKSVMEFVRDHPQFRDHHKYSWAPDEHFFHTIIGNSAFSGTTDGTVANAKRAGLTNLHFVPYGHFKHLATYDHLDMVLQSGKFFVRKVTTEASGRLLDHLDRNVLPT